MCGTKVLHYLVGSQSGIHVHRLKLSKGTGNTSQQKSGCGATFIIIRIFMKLIITSIFILW